MKKSIIICDICQEETDKNYGYVSLLKHKNGGSRYNNHSNDDFSEICQRCSEELFKTIEKMLPHKELQK